MAKARKYSLDFQHKEVSLVGKARKASRISSIKRLVWWRKAMKYSLDLQHKEVSLVANGKKSK